jgi:hypothetical protein
LEKATTSLHIGSLVPTGPEKICKILLSGNSLLSLEHMDRQEEREEMSRFSAVSVITNVLHFSQENRFLFPLSLNVKTADFPHSGQF